MKLDVKHNNVRQGGFSGPRSSFGVAGNAKMFRTLSDSLYEDKPGSIVRELTCNAVDAHRMAGKGEVPVQVHVPNAIEPWFSVKDEGVGLSDEGIRGSLQPVRYIGEDENGNETVITETDENGEPVMEFVGGIYNTYGESTKDQSNDQIGAFGLGSKTPFAYTDQFTVISVHGGMKRIYIAVLGDDGMPHISLQSELPSEDHPGLEVTMSVKSEDFRSFHDAIVTQLRFLPVAPALLNNLDGLTLPDLTKGVTFQNDYVTIYSNHQYRSVIEELWVTQGGVGYPLSLHRLGELADDVNEFAHALRRHGAVIDFPIGEVDVTASREGISYEETTIKNIIARLTKVAETMCQEAMDSILAEDSQWKRAAIFNKQIPVVQKALKNHSKFDAAFTHFMIPANARNYGHGVNMALIMEPLTKAGFKAVMMNKHEYTRRGTYDRGVRVKREDVLDPANVNIHYYGDSSFLYPTEDMHVFVRDTSKKPVARIKKFCEENDYPMTLVIEATKFDGELDDKVLKKIAKALCIDPSTVKLLSTLPAPPTKGRKNDARPRAYKYDPSNKDHSTQRSMEWEAVFESVDDLDDGIWIPMERHMLNVGDYGGECDDDEFRIFMAAYKRGLIPGDLPVYAVNMQTAKRITEGKVGAQHVTVKEMFDKHLRAQIEKAKAYRAAWAKYDGFVDGMNDRIMMRVMEHFGDARQFRGLTAVRERMAQLKERFDEWSFTFNTYQSSDNYQAGHAAGEKRSAAFYARYPLLKHLNIYHHDRESMQEVMNYINMVDASQGG